MQNFRLNPVLTVCMALACSLSLNGCPPSTSTKEEVPPSKPEMTLTIASLNLTSLNKRIEKSDIVALWRILKKEQVEVLAVQNMSRYPGVATRVDPLNELAAQADWRHAFGEMMDNSGRKIGNAVLATYPIRSNAHIPFTSVKSANFEGALETVIDGGVRDIMVVSAQFPPKAPESDLAKCLSAITSANKDTKMPLIVAGNVFASASGMQEVSAGSKNPTTRIHYSGGEEMKPVGASSVATPLGTVLIAKFALYRTH
ncbi:MAG: hypothetical protein A3G43_07355 [Ignavibacteria bacterium RIFCSPLOWO2_12_FULL_56_21]|nr:MAG: hypothetical protein A3G43_07355 [Ignavibacteria bacterium RIFCSPLOWO2_12_FULL_56_21]